MMRNEWRLNKNTFLNPIVCVWCSSPKINWNIHYLYHMSLGGWLEPIPANISEVQLNNQHRDKQPFTLTCIGYLESPINLICMSLDCGKKHPEKTLADTRRTCKLHTERLWLRWDSNLQSCCFEATVEWQYTNTTNVQLHFVTYVFTIDCIYNGRRMRDVTHWFLQSENEASSRRSPGAILPVLTPPSSWLTNKWSKRRSEDWQLSPARRAQCYLVSSG